MRDTVMSNLLLQPSTYRDYLAPSYNHHARPENVERNDMQMVHKNQQITRPSYHNLQLDLPRNYIEETSILKEISKKYILIPKLRTTFPNDGFDDLPLPVPDSSEKPNDIENNDWKSKYVILDQLKNREKEEEITKYISKDNRFDNTNNLDIATTDNDQVMQNYIGEELPTRYEEEIPEKDVSDQLVVENELKRLEKCKINDEIPKPEVTHMPSALSLNSDNATPYYDETQNEIFDQNAHKGTSEVNENLEYNTQLEHNPIPAEQNVEAVSHIDSNQYQENYPEQEFQPGQEQEYPIEYDQFIPKTEGDTHTELENVVNQEENDYSPIEVINPNELVDEINKDISVQEANAPANEYHNEMANEYPAEIANTQEFTPNDAVQQPVLQDKQGINSENYMTDDGTIVQGNPVPQQLSDDPTDNSGIEEFDAEQRDMFYSEQANENYAYDEQGTAGDAYNAEYAQNQNYPQAQEYAYYDGAQEEEGTYPVEINEHEETQQLYDQHYKQQYTTNYEQGYEQQAVYMEQDPTQPQFEEPALYDQAQQEFEQYNLEQTPETQEQVEQVLDREDGYIEKRVDDPTAKENQKAAELNVP